MTERRLVTVASTMPMAIRVATPNPKPNDPNYVHVPEHTAVIHGSNHERAQAGIGLTEGVDAEMMEQWLKANEGHEMADHVRIVSDEDVEKMRSGHGLYGFQNVAPESQPAPHQTEGQSVPAGDDVTSGRLLHDEVGAVEHPQDPPGFGEPASYRKP